MYKVIDVLSIASKSVSELLSLKLEVPPIPIDSVKKQDPANIKEENEKIPKGFILPRNKIAVYEIWKVFFEENKKEIPTAYVVLSADFVAEEYKNGKWENVEYRGFYTTIREAKNEISGYLR